MVPLAEYPVRDVRGHFGYVCIVFIFYVQLITQTKCKETRCDVSMEPPDKRLYDCLFLDPSASFRS